MALSTQLNYSSSTNFFSLKLFLCSLQYLSPHESVCRPCSYSLLLTLFSSTLKNFYDHYLRLTGSLFRRSECLFIVLFPCPQIFLSSIVSVSIEKSLGNWKIRWKFWTVHSDVPSHNCAVVQAFLKAKRIILA